MRRFVLISGSRNDWICLHYVTSISSSSLRGRVHRRQFPATSCCERLGRSSLPRVKEGGRERESESERPSSLSTVSDSWVKSLLIGDTAALQTCAHTHTHTRTRIPIHVRTRQEEEGSRRGNVFTLLYRLEKVQFLFYESVLVSIPAYYVP